VTPSIPVTSHYFSDSYPAHACAQRGYVIGRGVDIMYNYIGVGVGGSGGAMAPPLFA
jgi:hypothetical protein